jgi:hypothetical protein
MSYKIASRFCELRGFAPIGIVEWWNIGIMDFEKRGGWCLRVENHFGKELETENNLKSQYSIIPIFHYSSIS